ncbi:MAG: aldehyde dehydrogenase family protein [Planctomycetota bacterium]
MPDRLPVTKTHKLYINGAFPRSESGRSIDVRNGAGETVAHACLASRKDLREAVKGSASAQVKWAARTAYNRGQILYRIAEMLEGKRLEMVEAITLGDDSKKPGAEREVQASVDRFVRFAGWTDKFTQALGNHNPVAGPYYSFTIPEATGVVACVAPDDASLPLLPLVSLMAPALCAGNAVVGVGPVSNPLPVSVLGEVIHTSDVPGGVVNLLTGGLGELCSWISEHRAIEAVHAGGLDDDTSRLLREGASENVKRVRTRDVERDAWFDHEACGSAWWIEPFVEMKTIWHPSGV